MPHFKSRLPFCVLAVMFFLVLPNLASADCKDAAWKRYGQGSGSGEATYSQSLFNKWDWACHTASDCPDPPAVADPNKPVSKKIIEGGMLWADTGCTSGQACCGAIKGTALATGSNASTALPPEKLVVPKLNVDIPGLVFSDQLYIEDNQVYIPLLAQYIAAFFKYILGIGLVATAIMFVYSAFLYIYGATGLQVSDAKKKMTDALIGLLILLGSYVILSNLNPNTLNLGAIKFTRIDPSVWQAMETVNSNIPADQVSPSGGGGSSASRSIMAGTPIAGTCNAVDKVVNFKQAGGDWGSKPFGPLAKVCSPGETVDVTTGDHTEKKSVTAICSAPCCQNYGESACGMTSLADVLASYGENVTPGTLGQMYIDSGSRNCNCNGSSPTAGLNIWQAKKSIDKYSVKSLDKDVTAINQQLTTGHPIIFLCSKCQVCKMMSGKQACHSFDGHWMVLTGVYDNNTYGVSDPSNGDYTVISQDMVMSGKVGVLTLITPKDGSAINGCPR